MYLVLLKRQSFVCLCVCLCVCVCVCLCETIRLISYQIKKETQVQQRETHSAVCSVYTPTDCVCVCVSVSVCVCVCVSAAFIQEEKNNLSHIRCNRIDDVSLRSSINRLHYINVFNVRLAPRTHECAIYLQCWSEYMIVLVFYFLFFNDYTCYDLYSVCMYITGLDSGLWRLFTFNLSWLNSHSGDLESLGDTRPS